MITKIIKRLRKKIKANRKDINTCMQALVAMQQEQLDILQRFELHISHHIDRELRAIETDVMCH